MRVRIMSRNLAWKLERHAMIAAALGAPSAVPAAGAQFGLALAALVLQPCSMKHALLLLAFAAVACAPETPALGAAEQAPADAFLARLNELCGGRYVGKVVSTDAADAEMASQRLVMHVRDCSKEEVRIPFAVGDDRSRTWIVTRTAEGLRLKHDHRHADGTEDELSQYGGDTTAAGTPNRQEFPADAFSKELFKAKGNPASVDNSWAMEVDHDTFAYELRRPNRFFRVEFDLTTAVAE